MANADVRQGTVEIGIVVADLDAMMAFYGDVLGLEYVGEIQLPGALMKRYLLSDTVIKLVHQDRPLEGSHPPGGMRAPIAGLRYLTLRVDGVEEKVARCEAAGCRVPRATFEYRPGVPMAIVEDPEGNSIELITRTPG
ncbi:MAG TPA: VOC family protein [Acidimicrobiales bacterium]|nr:VOC family protein [Acidimicrobiales bacterium]